MKVSFDDLNAGWVALTILTDELRVEVVASYTPFDSFLALVNALHASLQVNGRQTVSWNEEPREVDLNFTRTGTTIALEARRFPDHRRRTGSGTPLLETSGTWEEVCLPFWRALRSLQGRFTAEELHARWHRDFPTNDLDELTAALDNLKRAQRS